MIDSKKGAREVRAWWGKKEAASQVATPEASKGREGGEVRFGTAMKLERPARIELACTPWKGVAQPLGQGRKDRNRLNPERTGFKLCLSCGEVVLRFEVGAAAARIPEQAIRALH